MKNMNEMTSFTDKAKEKAAKIFTDILIGQAEQGVKFSSALAISEPSIPIKLLEKGME